MRSLPAIAALALGLAVPAGLAATQSLPGSKTAKDRAAWRALLHWPTSCEKTWQQAGNPGGAGISVWKLNSEVRLVEVSCYLGAYQGTEMLFFARTDGRVSKALPLLIYEDPGSGTPKAHSRTMILGSMAFSVAKQRLTVLDKFRGVGDCGIYSTFGLTNDQFVPVEVRAKLACNGKPPYDPARWPKLPLPHG